MVLTAADKPPPPRWEDGKWRPKQGGDTQPCMTHLVLAVLHGHAGIARLLIDARAELDTACGPDLETAMHVGCSRGTTHLVKLLIDAGASLGLGDAIGRSPLLCRTDPQSRSDTTGRERHAAHAHAVLPPSGPAHASRVSAISGA